VLSIIKGPLCLSLMRVPMPLGSWSLRKLCTSAKLASAHVLSGQLSAVCQSLCLASPHRNLYYPSRNITSYQALNTSLCTFDRLRSSVRRPSGLERPGRAHYPGAGPVRPAPGHAQRTHTGPAAGAVARYVTILISCCAAGKWCGNSSTALRGG
jgi:hypothetical protein